MAKTPKTTVEAFDTNTEAWRVEPLLETRGQQIAIFNSANFSSIATDAKGVVQRLNIGAERMLVYTAAEVMNKTTLADISEPPPLIARAKLLGVELGETNTPGFEALVFNASRGIEDIDARTCIRKDRRPMSGAGLRHSAVRRRWRHHPISVGWYRQELAAVRMTGVNSGVRRAYGGRETINSARRELPDLFVLALMMPEVNRFEVVDVDRLTLAVRPAMVGRRLVA